MKWLEENRVILKGIACRVNVSIGHFGFPGSDPYYDAQKVLERMKDKLKNLSLAEVDQFLREKDTNDLGLSMSDRVIPQAIK